MRPEIAEVRRAEHRDRRSYPPVSRPRIRARRPPFFRVAPVGPYEVGGDRDDVAGEMGGVAANRSASHLPDALSSTSVRLTCSREDDLSPTNAAGTLRAFARKCSLEEFFAWEPGGELLATLVLLTYKMRPTAVASWEEVEILYAVVGGRRRRTHDGYLFSYKNSEWEKLSAPTPSIVLKDVSAALVSFVGFYLCCGKHTGVETARKKDSLLRRAKELLMCNGPRDFADKTVIDEGHFLRNPKGPARTPVDGGVRDWAERLGGNCSKLP